MEGESHFIQTVLGPVPPREFTPCLVHEHLLVDFVGADKFARGRYDRKQVYATMLPFLLKIKAQGMRGFVECTPMYLGRDPELLRLLSSGSGMHIVTNTGLYAAGAREGEPEPYLPRYGYLLSAEELAGGWLKEWFEGIEGTDVKPGMIKIGVNRGELREASKRIVRAAAITSRRTSLAIACHTASGIAGLQILDILEAEKVPPQKYVFVHAQAEENFQLHLDCARRGAWMEYDGIGPDSAEKHRSLILRMLEAGFEEQILISQDAGWYRPGEPNGGRIRGFEFLLQDFVPMLLQSGTPQATVDHLLAHNPIRALQLDPTI